MASFGLNSCGGGAVNATDYSNGNMIFSSPAGQSKVLSGTLSFINTCQTQTVPIQTNYMTFSYVGSPPWTVTCAPVPGVGWIFDVKLYQIGN